MMKAGAENRESVDRDARRQARDAAQEAGKPLGDWLDDVVAAHALKVGADVNDFDPAQRRDIIAGHLGRIGAEAPRSTDWNALQDRSERLRATVSRRQWRDRDGETADDAANSPPSDTRRHGSTFPLPGSRELLDREANADGELEAAMDQRQRQGLEKEIKTAEALADATHWIKRGSAQTRAAPDAERGALDVIVDRLARIESFLGKSYDERGAASCRETLLQLHQRVDDVVQEHEAKAHLPAGLGNLLHDLADRLTDLAESLERTDRGGTARERADHLRRLESKLAGVLASFERQIGPPQTMPPVLPVAIEDAERDAPSLPQRDTIALEPALLSPKAEAAPATTVRRAGLDRRSVSLTSISTAVAEIAKRQQDLERGSSAPEPEFPEKQARLNAGAAALPLIPASAKGQSAADVAAFEQRLEDIARRIERATEKVEPNERHAPETEGIRNDIAQISRAVSALSDNTQQVGEHGLDGLRSEIARLAGQLEQTRLGAPEPASEALRADLKEMSRVINQMAAAKSSGEGSAVAVLKSEMSGLAQRLDEARSPEPHPELARLRHDVTEISAAIADVLPRNAIASLETAVRDLSSRVETVSSSGGTHATLLAPLEKLVGEVRSAVERVDSRDTGAIDGHIRRIGDKLEQITRQGCDPAAVARIHDQTREIRDLLAVAVQRPTAFDGLEQRMIALGERLEHIVGETSRRDAPEGPANAQDIRSLLQDVAPAAAVAALEGRFEAMASRIDAVLAKAAPIGAIDMISDRVDRIHQAIQTQAQATATQVSQTQTPAQTRSLEAMVRRLADSVEQMHTGELDPRAMETMEALIGKILARLDKSDASFAALGSLERNVRELFSKLDETRLASELAVSKAVREAFDTGAMQTKRPHDDAISHDLGNLRTLYAESDRRMHATLSAVHSTLERVVERLAVLDEEPRATRDPLKQEQQKPRTARESGMREPAIQVPSVQAAMRPSVQAAPAAAAKAGTAKPTAPLKPDFLIDPSAEKPVIRADARGRDGGAERIVEPVADAATPAGEPAKAPSASFIAAARRAAQAAAVESAAAKRSRNPIDAVASLAGGNRADQLKTFIAEKKRPILLAVAGLVVLVGAFEVFRTVTMPGIPVTPAARAPSVETTRPDAGSRSEASPKASGNAATASLDTNSTASLPPPRNVLPLSETAQAGDAKAQFEMGVRLSEGRQMGKDFPAAARWFEKAAAQGLAPAQYRLGALYEKGTGVPQDLTLALAWYEKAAAAGNARAMHNLAVITAEGGGGKPNYATAATWFRKAAELGVRDSQYNLAILTARGLGTTQDLPESYMWFSLAAQQGDTDAAKKRDEVAKQLDAQNMAAAQAKVAAFATLPPNRDANVVSPPPGGWDPAPRLQRGVQMPHANVSSL